MIRRILLALLLLGGATAASAQTVQQSGSVTPGHIASWATSGVIQDAGTATAGKINTFGLYGNGGTPLAITNSATQGPFSGAYSQMGLGISHSAAYINIGNYGGDPVSAFQININGTNVFSAGTSGVSLPLAQGLIFVGNTSGVAAPVALSQDCSITFTGAITCLSTNGVPFTTAATTALGTSGATIPLNNGNNTFSGTNTVSGSFNYTGALKISGVTQTFPVSGILVGTTDTQTLTNKSIAASEINSGNLPVAQLPALASANVWVGNGSGAAAPVAVSGDAALANTGALTVGSIGGKAVSLGAALTTTGTGTPTLAFGSTGYTYNYPAATGTLAELGLAQTWGATQTFLTSGLAIQGSSTGSTALASANSSATNYTATVPAGNGNVLESVSALAPITGTPTSSTFIRGDGTWASPAGGGTVVGPGSTVSGYVPVWSGTSGTVLAGGLPVGTTSAAGQIVETNGSGLINPGVLGTGTASATTYLTGAGTFTTIPAGGVRQTVLNGASSGGAAAFISNANGNLQAGVLGTATPLTVSFANGFAAGGQSDTVAQVSADNATFFPAVAANEVSYLYATDSAGSLTGGATLAPPQYGPTYNQAAQSSLTLNNKSTDDFGNTWTNNAVTFSNTALAGFPYAGTSYGVFNGTSSYMRNTGITSLGTTGNRGWTIRFKLYTAASIATNQTLFNLSNNVSGNGWPLTLYLSAGKISLYGSSTNTGPDVVNIQASTALATSTAYDIEVDFDPVALSYYTYVNGSTATYGTSSAAAGGIYVDSGASGLWVGTSYYSSAIGNYLTGDIQGFEVKPYCAHPGGISFTPQTALSNIAAAGYASDWFDTTNYVMNSVSAASSTAGVNPTFTNPLRVYLGEALAATSTLSSVTSYAFQGQYQSAAIPVVGSTAYTFNDNLGLDPSQVGFNVYSSQNAGPLLPQVMGQGDGTYGYLATSTAFTRNVAAITTQTNPIGGTASPHTSGFYKLTAKRNW